MPPPAVSALPTAGLIASGVGSINVNAAATAMTVNQATNNMIVNWGSFNIGSAASVNFVQPGVTSSVLNRVSAAGGLSQIYGKLTANGQVYLINPNGILFGNGATVNVNSLIASSLNISDSLFNNGFLTLTDGSAAFTGTKGFVQVDAGASITSASGGKVMMFAPNIINNGLINTPDGQTLLAAGQKVYLTVSDDLNLRGLLVEVDSGGATENLGSIVAERGNVTLAGIAVNQNGRVQATTSVNANGSIRLQARDTTTFDPAGLAKRLATVGGNVNLGENSLTEVTPELTDKTTVLDTVDVKKSNVDIFGTTIHLNKNAWVVAAGGNVNVSAELNPSAPTINPAELAIANASRIYLESGSGIDVSGVGSGSTAPSRITEKPVELSVANNIVTAELRGSELADSPLQRNGILYKAKVFVDSQVKGSDGSVGTSVANVSGYIAQIGHNVGERLSTGGSVNLQSEGDIVIAPNATIDVSGGKVDYLGGIVNKTRLLASNGQIYDIANATKDLKYVDIQNVSYRQQGYSTGKDAGKVTISAPAMVLEGQLRGDTIAGLRQRTMVTMPKGASLQIGQNQVLVDQVLKNLSFTNILHSDLVFDGFEHVSNVPSFLESLTVDQRQTLHLGNNFTPNSFSNLNYFADGEISVNQGINIETKPGGSIVLNGGGADVKGNLTSHDGNIDISVKRKVGYIGLGLDKNFSSHITQNIEVGADSKLNVSGLWVNDKQNAGATAVLALDGGIVSLSASGDTIGGDVLLKSGGIINASGGAWLNSSGKLSDGKGGDISLKASGGYLDAQVHSGKLLLDGTLLADSLSTGGSLNLTSGSVTIGNKSLATNGELLINPMFFSTGGFSAYSISGYEGLSLEENTTLTPFTLTRVLDSGFSVQDSGSNITNFSHLSLLPANNAANTRKATNLSLNAITETSGNLNLGIGSSIVTDPGANVSLFGRRQLTVLGSVIAPAGSISMTLGKDPDTNEIVHFMNNQTLWLGSNSLLDVSGVTSTFLNVNGFHIGNVKDAGSITLDAKKGTVIAENGSRINLTGTRSILDVKSGNSFVTKDIASRGGNLAISAREGVLFDATMNAQGGNVNVASGSFALDLHETVSSVNNDIFNQADQYPIVPLEILLKNTGNFVPTGMIKDGAVDTNFNGKAYVAVDKIKEASFDSVSLMSPNNIRFTENSELSSRGAINIDAPNLLVENDSHVLVEASNVTVGNSKQEHQDATFVSIPKLGNGSFDIKADNIELLGKQNLSGIASADIFSRGDIQLKGVLPTNKKLFTPSGELITVGDLNLSSATTYPSTYSNYTLTSIGKDSAISFHQSGRDSGVPFSVMGTLNVVADNIVQDGVLRAPFGVINLNATNNLTLKQNSLTSVSSEGKTLPFGTTLNGKSWSFDEGDRTATVTNFSNKQVNLDGKSIKTDVGSIIDISGGGDLSALEFTTGTGGSEDVLAAEGVFAIIPNLKSGYMSGNSEFYGNGVLKAGDSIYLSGGNGLKAGNYVLLPAHYALLPGGYSIKEVVGTQDFSVQQNILNKDGSMLVSGYRTQFGNITADARTSGFLVSSGAIARSQSEYTNTLASNFINSTDTTFASGLRLPADAGRVAIDAISDLVLDGTLISNHDKLARGSEVDISSDKIAISGDGISTAGFLTLSSDKLNAIGAESLIIGAKASDTADGKHLDIVSSNVKMVNGASLTGQEITIAATDTVTMESGTSINAVGTVTKNSEKLIVSNANVTGSGDGALLRVSSGNQPNLVRENVTQTKGSLDVQSGAKIAGVSVILDATKANSINGDITLAKDGAIRLGAPNISFGAPTAPVAGLLLDNNKLAALGNPSNIELKSYNTIDFYGNAEVGNAALKTLTFESAGLTGVNNSGSTVTLTADTIKFANLDGASFNPVGSVGSGTLVVNAAKEIGLGAGAISLAGFSNVNLTADQVIGEDKGTLNVTGNLAIDTGRIIAAGASNQTIQASGNLQTLKHTVTGLAPAPLGGKLTLMADTITHGGLIDMPSGIVTLNAKSTSGVDSLILKSGSQINVNGSEQLLGTIAALADAGTINLQTANGNISLELGSLLDVSATGGANAGKVVINSEGNANFAGTLNGLAAIGNGVGLPKQGSFELSANTLGDFALLNSTLEQGMFTESRNIHIAQGDITLAATDTLTSHNIKLTTDDGNLTIAGRIEASGTNGGKVNLNAGQRLNDGKGNITLVENSAINANATSVANESAGSIGDGGKVTINTATDKDTSPSIGSRIIAAIGSVIDVSGQGLGNDGMVSLRTPRLGMANNLDAGNDIAVSQFGTNVKGVNASIVAEGVKVYETATIDNPFISLMKADNNTFLANANLIKSHLGIAPDRNFVVASGDEVRSNGNITVTDNITLANDKAIGLSDGPGALTLRAAGDVNINASISAGFTTSDNTGRLTNGGAWSYHITSGANLGSADVLAINNFNKGDFTIAPDALLRTGTGDIEISTGGNFKLDSITSAIYTAGEKDTTNYNSLGNFVNPTASGVPATYTVNGGDILVNSKGSIEGVSYSLDIDGNLIYQLPSDWLYRSGPFNARLGLTKNTSWWTSYGTFQENIGTLSGGDVNISAGGDIKNLSAVVATNGRVFRSSPSNSTLVVNGGGDLSVEAGGNIQGGLYMVDKGTANIRSDGALVADENSFNTVFALGDASVDVTARGQLDLLTVFNPMSTRLSLPNFKSENKPVYFTTYGGDSNVTLTSLSKGVTITNQVDNLPNDLESSSIESALLQLYPSSLYVGALGGDFKISGNIAMLPSANGDLQIAAKESIIFDNNAHLAMSDIDIVNLPSAVSPSLISDRFANLLQVNEGANYHAAIPLHENDSKPVLLFAGIDIIGSNDTSLVIPKKATIVAGHDIKDFSVSGQNLKASDISTISAGNDFVFSTGIENGAFLSNFKRIDWGGPGFLNVTADRNINLNNSFGIVTSGNLRNPSLPDKGASINVLAGASNSDDEKLIAKYIDPAANSTYVNDLSDFVKNLTGNNELSDAQAWITFQGLDGALKHQFTQSVFFKELREAGVEHNDPNSAGFGSYQRGYDAIGTYFPGKFYDGNVDMSFSQIKSLRGGDVNLMIPGGSAVIGLPKIPIGVVNAKNDTTTPYDDTPSLLGLVTVNGGNINVFSMNNIDVAQSREFTLAGGDLLNWSSFGDIDAGKGAKTATSAPPPLVRTDSKGNTVIDLSGVVSGSGIGTLQTVAKALPGNTFLIAPNGTVNAGDAGIRSSGNLLVAAQRVIGADNISVGGTSSGVPAVTTVNVSFNAPVSADSTSTNKQGDQIGAADKLGANSKMANLLSLISVEVLSLGDDANTTDKKETSNKKCNEDKNKKDCAP